MLKQRFIAVGTLIGIVIGSTFLAGCRHVGSDSGPAAAVTQNPEASPSPSSDQSDAGIEAELQALEKLLDEAESETVESDSLSPSNLGL